MRRPTDLMVQILKNPKSQEIIDYVSDIYGESYVGLWLFEIIGYALNKAYSQCIGLRDETSPVSSTWALDYFEDEYGLGRGENMTAEQRRARIINKMNQHFQCNPARICDAVSAAIGGVEVQMIENYDENTFLINIRDAITDFTPVEEVLDEMKPAHLIYEIRTALLTAINMNFVTAIAVTKCEKNIVEVLQ